MVGGGGEGVGGGRSQKSSLKVKLNLWMPFDAKI